MTYGLFRKVVRALDGSTLCESSCTHFFFFFLAKSLASNSRRSSSSFFFLKLISILKRASYSSTCRKKSGYRFSSSARCDKSVIFLTVF